MMIKVDWSKAPEDAQFYSLHQVRKHENGNEYIWDDDGTWRKVKFDKIETHRLFDDFELRPSLDDSNCNTYNPDETPSDGELEQLEADVRRGNLKPPTADDYVKEAAQYAAQSEVKVTTKTSIQFLDEVKAIQEERAAEYEQEGGERSFAKIATVFNTYTGHNLQPSDIALILEILKNVRFYSNTGYHKDSVIDALSYTSLWAELVTQERDKR